MRTLASLLALFGLLLAALPAAGSADVCTHADCLGGISVAASLVTPVVQPGATVQMQLTVTNNGPPESVWVSPVVPPVNVFPPGCTAQPDNEELCFGKELATGESQQFTLTFGVLTAGTFQVGGRGLLEHAEHPGSGRLRDAPGAGARRRPAPSPAPATTTATTTPAAPAASATPTSGPAHTAPAPKVQITLASHQRVLKTGGVMLHVKPAGPGTLDARAIVSLPGGRSLTLARIWQRNVRTGQSVRVWLGTTAAMKRALKAGLAKHRTLRARVRVVYGTAPATRTLVRTVTLSA